MQRRRRGPGQLRLQHPVRVDVVRRHQGQLPDASADDAPANSLVLAVAVAISLADTSADDGCAVAVAISLADTGADDGIAIAVAISLADTSANDGSAYPSANNSPADARADDAYLPSVRREAPPTATIAWFCFRSWFGRRLLRDEPDLGICSR